MSVELLSYNVSPAQEMLTTVAFTTVTCSVSTNTKYPQEHVLSINLFFFQSEHFMTNRHGSIRLINNQSLNPATANVEQKLQNTTEDISVFKTVLTVCRQQTLPLPTQCICGS